MSGLVGRSHDRPQTSLHQGAGKEARRQLAQAMLALLSPRLWIALALAGLLAFSHLTAYRKGKATVRADWDAANVAMQAEVQAHAARNRELQRAAELRYTVAAQQRERFIVATVKEIHEAAAPLADCRVPEPAIRLLNAARDCADGNSAAACGAGDPLPAAR